MASSPTSDRLRGRWVTVAAAVAVAAWVAVGLRTNLANLQGSFSSLGLLDAQVYRMGGGALVNGRPLYEALYVHDNLPFTYTPFAAALFVPLYLLGWQGGAVAITVASLLALGRVAVVLGRAVGEQRGRPLGPRWLMPALLLAVGLSIWPTRSTLEYGQINLVVLWLIVEDVLGVGRSPRGARWAGVLTGLAVGIKLTPAFLVPWHLAVGQRARAARVVAAALATVAIGFVMQPSSAWAYWTRWIFDPSRVGDPAYAGNQSLNGLLTRLAGAHPPSLVTVGAALVAAGAALAVGTVAVRRGRLLDGLAVVLLGTLLVSPISWSHHWVSLVVVVAALLAAPAGERRVLRLVRAAVAVALVLLAQPRVMFLVPNGGGAEYHLGVGQQVLASAYVLGGLALLAVFAVVTLAAPAVRPAADESGAEEGVAVGAGAVALPEAVP